MKIQYCSDLHLEFPENKKFLTKNPLVAKGDVLILAGDVVPFSRLEKHHDFFDFAAENFEATYWIPGNHEYYHSDASQRSNSFCETIRENVFLLNNYTVKRGETRMIFTTLWSNISPLNQWEIQQNISDFYEIEFNDGKFLPEHFNELHKQCLHFLEAALQEETTGNSVVITHHVPTLANYPEIYTGSSLNEVFAVELKDLIEEKGPDYWIFGHHHQNVEKFRIGSTELVTNQLGYVRMREHLGFSTQSIISV